MRRSTIALGGAFAAAALMRCGVPAEAAQVTIVLGPATYSVQAEATAAGTGQYNSRQTPGSVSANDDSFGLISTEEANASAAPVQHVSASGAISATVLAGRDEVVGVGEAILSYSFEVIDNKSGIPQPVAIDIRANGTASVAGQGSANGEFQLVETGLSGGAKSLLDLDMCAGLGCAGTPASIRYAQQNQLMTYTPYVINLAVIAGAANAGAAPYSGSGSATIDPYFALDPSVLDPQDYTLLFSAGIVNSPGNMTAVPEPATWALLGAGFALLQAAAMGRRRLPRLL
jgi:hypothetical protein